MGGREDYLGMGNKGFMRKVTYKPGLISEVYLFINSRNIYCWAIACQAFH